MSHNAVAVLLIAHGSRRPEANVDVRRVAEQLAASGDYAVVEVAYLELAAPSIPDAACACVVHGATEVRLLPYFLSAGTHVVDDLHHIRNELAATYPGVTFHLCPPLGVHPLLIDVVRERLRESL